MISVREDLNVSQKICNTLGRVEDHSGMAESCPCIERSTVDHKDRVGALKGRMRERITSGGPQYSNRTGDRRCRVYVPGG